VNSANDTSDPEDAQRQQGTRLAAAVAMSCGSAPLAEATENGSFCSYPYVPRMTSYNEQLSSLPSAALPVTDTLAVQNAVQNLTISKT